MDLAEEGRLRDYPSLSAMGPEPLSAEFDDASLARACKGKKVSLKVALLDQRVVAGLGNIYASEALHHARLSPLRKASTIATASGAPKAISDAAGGVDQGRADERDQAARVTVPIRALQGLRTGRTTVFAARLRRNDPPAHPGGTVDLLLSEMPALN